MWVEMETIEIFGASSEWLDLLMEGSGESKMNDKLPTRRLPRCPLVSILIPTRKRKVLLFQTMEFLWNLSLGKSLEFILRIDDDDTDTLHAVERLDKRVSCKALVGPRGRGYLDIHLYLDQMARVAEGLWLLIYGDDCEMATYGWDQNLAIIPVYEDGIMALAPKIRQRAGSNEILFLLRHTYQILGSMGKSAHVDTWISTIMIMLDRLCRIESIEINHPNDKILDDSTRDRDKILLESNKSLRDTMLIREKIKDTEKLLAYMDRVRGDRSQAVGLIPTFDWLIEPVFQELMRRIDEHGMESVYKSEEAWKAEAQASDVKRLLDPIEKCQRES